GDVRLPAGHILSMLPDGSDVQLFAGGLRNPLDIAFNKDGDLFTFDADMERDVGTPWYMPTRVLHVVPGADFGWRRGTGRWPAWYPDTLPSVIDIGLSSPTAIFFGYGSAFPERYQEALFLFDWSYGRIIAVHLTPNGKSYAGEQETFISGRPLNVTDGAIGPDGALWFTTGGRGTQSGLYRVVWEGTAAPEPKSMLSRTDAHAHERHAKRMELERSWSDHVESDFSATNVPALLAAARIGTDEDRLRVIDSVLDSDFAKLAPADLRDRLRVMEVAIARCDSKTQLPKAQMLAQLSPLFPTNDALTNRQLCKFLVYLQWPQIPGRCATLLHEMTASEDLLFYPFILRSMKTGWTLDARRVVFAALNRAEKLNGASTYFKAIADTRAELAAPLNPAEAEALADLISPPQPVALASYALPTHTFKNWKLEDLLPLLPKVAAGRSHAGAKQALISSQCVFCHRVIADASLPAGVFGPDLSQVSARFGRADLLDHILNPSKVIDDKFRLVTVTKTDGAKTTGILESEDDERVTLKPNPLSKETIEIAKSQIRERVLSEVSPMPAGLLNALKADQILDMLAWFEAGGNADHPAFKDRPPSK
ncbi:MAG: hypothetical protein KDK97_09085, partial [Verrucomicrobiales bacterium]|nr:hypothetical protein [Verrucomicrobiales bacterium]